MIAFPSSFLLCTTVMPDSEETRLALHQNGPITSTLIYFVAKLRPLSGSGALWEPAPRRLKAGGRAEVLGGRWRVEGRG
ncbi:hypothetical protein E2C01_065395 [Portunus trituberculatus]|uniref:Uncharacterized protein n=1 Tax=Portunus trituberculatus TaxID=210409 RepID=A0A5B7HMG6_PORTR|nr:hypothetical protein [Portunus trituberculatus]